MYKNLGCQSCGVLLRVEWQNYGMVGVTGMVGETSMQSRFFLLFFKLNERCCGHISSNSESTSTVGEWWMDWFFCFVLTFFCGWTLGGLLLFHLQRIQFFWCWLRLFFVAEQELGHLQMIHHFAENFLEENVYDEHLGLYLHFLFFHQ